MEAITIKHETIVISDDDMDIGGDDGGGCGNDFTMEMVVAGREEPLAIEPLAMVMPLLDDCGSRSSSSSSAFVPKLMGRLDKDGIIPFVRKTFEIVNDPKTNSIISWTDNGTSFVVWNFQKFYNNIAPKYFKHNHYQTFIRQLNAYGFYKVHRGENKFANKWFQAGKRHLLKNITRKKIPSSNDNSIKLELEKLKQEVVDIKKRLK